MKHYYGLLHKHIVAKSIQIIMSEIYIDSSKYENTEFF